MDVNNIQVLNKDYYFICTMLPFLVAFAVSAVFVGAEDVSLLELSDASKTVHMINQFQSRNK